MQEREFKGIWIPRDIWLNTELSIIERALLAEIDSLNPCTAGNEYFAQFFGVSVPTITRAIANLKSHGLIVTEFDGRVRTCRLIKMISLPNQDDEHISNSISNTNNQSNLFEDSNTSNKEEENNKKGQKFVDDYNRICKSLPKCQRLSPKRSKGIANLLKKYPYETIITVFEKVEASDFCSGRSTNWRADIDFILREDKFISILEGKYDNRKRRCNVETISGGDKKQLSAEEKERIINNGKKF